ncbi:pyridoxal-phosphate dependent enzyme [Actinomadura flavalba]|uniref:pyridoxal-phosphate dependent enzyme n=1 Tax=Actinomadura flavalba TaxID=1120938 RepID=UPI00035CE6E4|nr:pyridoxal-phosphate dependent enzyme [Actinomadura flavalba]
MDDDPTAWPAAALRRLDAERAALEPTPLRAFPLAHDVAVLLKDESALPTGSLKHRAARALFRHAIASGRITEGTPVVEATGGGAALAQATFARLLGLPYTAVLPGAPDPRRAAPLEALGAEVRFVTPPLAIYATARELAAATGGCFLDQYAHAAHALDHRGDDPAIELAAQLPAPPAWIVAGAGTGATAAAFGRHARTYGTGTRLAVADPENSACFPAWVTGDLGYATGMPSRIEGIGRPRVEPGFLPGLYDLVVPVPDAASVAAARAARAATGLPVGGSTGTCLWAALHLAARPAATGTTIVAVLGDAADRHLRTVHDDAWAAAKGLDPAPYAAALDRFAAGGPFTPP